MQRAWRFVLGVAIAVGIVSFASSAQFRQIYALPERMHIMQGETALFRVDYPLTVSVEPQRSGNVLLRLRQGDDFFARPVFLESVNLGRATVDFRLLGVIPIKQVEMDVVPPMRMVAGGQSIGVVLQSEGVIVVGNSEIEESSGGVNPAKEAGVEVGDTILCIDGVPVETDVGVAECIDRAGREKREAELLLRRGAQTLTVRVRPVLCKETKRYRIGLFVRDRAVGVGTLTFYDPETHGYGALGHVIADGDTNQTVACRSGKIVPASVSGIQSGTAGHPGEKIGNFINEEQIVGTIEKNSKFGIYGKVREGMESYMDGPTVEVASMQQVETGPAEILTVVDGQTVERFAIEIEKIHLQSAPEGKGLVLRVTDERLLARTGGIVQGMSGSPILQNGKLVGAVTHVFVHDPARGYGCFMDWMLMESGRIPERGAQRLPQLFG